MKKALTVAIQIIGAFLLGVTFPYFMGIGNGLELIAIPIGAAIGVWLPSYLLLRESWKSLMGGVIGGFIGMFLINNIIPPQGFAGILFPIVGTFIGFYLPKLFKKLI